MMCSCFYNCVMPCHQVLAIKSSDTCATHLAQCYPRAVGVAEADWAAHRCRTEPLALFTVPYTSGRGPPVWRVGACQLNLCALLSWRATSARCTAALIMTPAHLAELAGGGHQLLRLLPLRPSLLCH